MGTLQQAVTHLEAGDWEAAHTIAQADETALGSWAHGIVHLMEGDLGNADYWYRKADRARPEPAEIAAEIAALKAALG